MRCGRRAGCPTAWRRLVNGPRRSVLQARADKLREAAERAAPGQKHHDLVRWGGRWLCRACGRQAKIPSVLGHVCRGLGYGTQGRLRRSRLAAYAGPGPGAGDLMGRGEDGSVEVPVGPVSRGRSRSRGRGRALGRAHRSPSGGLTARGRGSIAGKERRASRGRARGGGARGEPGPQVVPAPGGVQVPITRFFGPPSEGDPRRRGGGPRPRRSTDILMNGVTRR